MHYICIYLIGNTLQSCVKRIDGVFFFPGTFGECSSELEVQHWMRYNVFLLLDVGAFTALMELLNMEIE